MKDLNSKV